jgi:Transcription factor TFIIH complex subunit Tfb5
MKRSSPKNVKQKDKSSSSAAATRPPPTDSATKDDLPPSAGYLISCDIPTKQFIENLNDQKPSDKRFILSKLDETHLLVQHKAKDEILRRIEDWEDSNVFSAVEKFGEDLDMS